MPGIQQYESADFTVISPSQRAEVEAFSGISLRDADPEAIRFIVEKSKKAGNEAFKAKRYEEAIKMYSQAIAGDDHDHTLFANRSAAYLAIGLYDYALWDSQKAVDLSPTWSKGYYRLGCAHESLHHWVHARDAFQNGLHLDPSNKEFQQRLTRIQQVLDEELRSKNIAAATERRSLILKLRKARREDQRLAMLNQFKQSMTAPDWELEDLEWRPSWSQTLRSRPLDVAAIKKSPKSSALLSFIESLSDLSFPKAAIRIISDAARIHGYSAAISGHQQLHQGADVDTAGDDITRANLVYGKRVLCLSAGGGIMPIMCAAAGAHSVTAIERSRMLYRMAKQVLESNMSMLKQSGCDGAIELVPQSLYAFNTESAQTASSSADSPARHGPSSGAPTESITLPASATAALHDHDVLIIDLFDHGILGMGVLPALDYAAGRLLSSSCIVCPSTVYVYACLVQVCLDKPVQGFDLSPLNSYRWYPGSEKIDLTSIPHQKLSKPFLACTVHLQDRVQSKLSLFTTTSEEGDGVLHQESGNHGVHGAAAECCWEIDEHIDVEITGDGWWNGIVYWFELEMPRKMRGSELGDGVREVRLASYIADTPPETTCSAAGDDAPSAMHRVYCPSWGQAIQYTDGMRVTTGSTTTVRVRQDAGQICFMTCPPSCRLRHALTARWHYDMVLDEMRNGAYDAALRKAISKVKCIRNPGDENAARQRDTKVIALDMGAGTGLLSMMAARAGADEVYAAEMSAHMCDVAEETTIMNGFLGKIYVVDRDVRRMDVVAKPNGTAPELPGRVDLAVFEVFDSGLIGEGVLHILAAAKARLLKENAILVPSSAVVYAQPIEMRLDKVAGIDVSQANRWRWRADYEGVELNKCRNQWKPLAEPLPVFSFDFYDVYSCGCPSEQLLSFQITSNGVFNGVAMWFDLHLDEETSLSTSPYAEKGPTWQQAVQWMQELRVTPGDEINITARHDSYSISYEVKEQHNVVLNERFTTGVPMVDPVWKAAHDALHRANAELAKACVQNPLEYRSIAQTSVEFASRPHDVGLDASQAAEFCMKMMG